MPRGLTYGNEGPDQFARAGAQSYDQMGREAFAIAEMNRRIESDAYERERQIKTDAIAAEQRAKQDYSQSLIDKARELDIQKDETLNRNSLALKADVEAQTIKANEELRSFDPSGPDSKMKWLEIQYRNPLAFDEELGDPRLRRQDAINKRLFEIQDERKKEIAKTKAEEAERARLQGIVDASAMTPAGATIDGVRYEKPKADDEQKAGRVSYELGENMRVSRELAPGEEEKIRLRQRHDAVEKQVNALSGKKQDPAKLAELQSLKEQLGWTKPAGTPAPATTQPKQLDADTAKAILGEAGGDKAKARQLAKDRGFGF